MTEAGDRGQVVCLGEALVDLVCEHPVRTLGDAKAFVPRVGGSVANIAITAARFGSRTRMLGAVGDDHWGRWLRSRIGAEGVDVAGLRPVAGVAAPLAFVAVSSHGEPAFAFYGSRGAPVAPPREELDRAFTARTGVLVVGSDSLHSAADRDLTLAAAERARERGWTVLCDPNLRSARWEGERQMLDAVRGLVSRSDVIKCNVAEARALTGSSGADEAAAALLAGGARAVALTLGADGALLAHGDDRVRVAAATVAEVVDATGAGDSVAGVLAAALARGASREALVPALRVAMDAASAVAGAWGATTGLPPSAAAQATLAAALGRSPP